jgi:hypothetical protein
MRASMPEQQRIASPSLMDRGRLERNSLIIFDNFYRILSNEAIAEAVPGRERVANRSLVRIGESEGQGIGPKLLCPGQ